MSKACAHVYTSTGQSLVLSINEQVSGVYRKSRNIANRNPQMVTKAVNTTCISPPRHPILDDWCTFHNFDHSTSLFRQKATQFSSSRRRKNTNLESKREICAQWKNEEDWSQRLCGYFQRFEAARTWRSFQVLLRKNVTIARTTKLNTPVHSTDSASCQQNFKNLTVINPSSTTPFSSWVWLARNRSGCCSGHQTKEQVLYRLGP